MKDDFGNTQYQCDCSGAVDGNTRYTGKYCQDAIVKVCDYSQGVFCRNGGVCKDGPDGGSYCQCDEDYHGDLCEKDPGTPCGNGNTCHNGSPCVKDGENGPYCDCSKTTILGIYFTGDSCDEEQNVYCSEDKSHFCLNGSTCVDEGNG